MDIEIIKKEVRDQGAHILAAASIAMLFAITSILTWTLAGALMGLIREATEQEFEAVDTDPTGRKRVRRPLTLAKLIEAAATSKLDLAGWAAGGAIGFIIWEFIL